MAIAVTRSQVSAHAEIVWNQMTPTIDAPGFGGQNNAALVGVHNWQQEVTAGNTGKLASVEVGLRVAQLHTFQLAAAQRGNRMAAISRRTSIRQTTMAGPTST